MNRKDIKDGMLLQVRDGGKYYYLKGKMFYWADNNKYGDYFVSGFYYDDNLKCTCDKSLDIMKIYYMDKLLWERKTDWSKVPFGTKVRAWRYDGDKKQVGRLLHYDENGTRLKFLVFIENIACSKWFECCELLQRGDIVG